MKIVARKLFEIVQGLSLKITLILLAVSQWVRAELPVPIDPSTGAPGGNWLELVKGYIKDGAIILGLALSVVAFLWIAWTALAKFNEARRGRGDVEWGELGMLTIVGGALLLFITFLLNEAANVIS